MHILPSIIEINKVAAAVAVLLTEEQVQAIQKKKASKGYESLLATIGDEFKGEKDQLILLHTYGKISPPHIIAVGVGKEKELSVEKIRRGVSSAVRKVKAMKLEDFALHAHFDKIGHSESVKAAVEGLILSNYAFIKYKTEDKDKRKELKKVTLLVEKLDFVKDTIAETQLVCQATNFVRDMQNENADIMHSLEIERIAKEVAKKNKLKITVFDEKELKKMGANLILAVGNGSRYPPRLIIVEYNGNKGSKDCTALVGKGITFDSGGLNLKPTKYIETMRLDMSGAAIVLGTLKAASELKLRKNLIGVFPVVENMIGPGAYKPGDVYVSYSGKSVEIGNTDAEGRLVLADALSYTVKNLKPSRIIDLATLTGAITVTFGDQAAGMMGTDKGIMKGLFDAGEATYERVWELPLYEEYSDDIKSEIADMNNVTPGFYAGSITAAAFLKKFVEETPWVHLDIAGTAWYEKMRYYQPKNGTGFGVRLLIEYLKAH